MLITNLILLLFVSPFRLDSNLMTIDCMVSHLFSVLTFRGDKTISDYNV